MTEPTGEQKALLIGLVLAHARLIATDPSVGAPILLFDEISAHLDGDRLEECVEIVTRVGNHMLSRFTIGYGNFVSG